MVFGPAGQGSVSKRQQVQDKLEQRKFFQRHRIPTGSFLAVEFGEDLREAAEVFGFPFMLKATRYRLLSSSLVRADRRSCSTCHLRSANVSPSCSEPPSLHAVQSSYLIMTCMHTASRCLSLVERCHPTCSVQPLTPQP